MKSSIFSESIIDSDWQSISNDACSEDSSFKFNKKLKEDSIINK